jgi:L-ascorbate metabolism protein UlaG (beta-lactamase superfamily)
MLFTALLFAALQSSPPPPPSSPSVEMTYVGGPTALIEIDGLRILTDPTFDAVDPTPAKDAMLVKTMGPAIAPKDLGPIDLVLLSHDEHLDNLDRLGRDLLKSVKQTLTTEGGAARLKGNATGLRVWGTHFIKTPNGRTLKVTALPARHGPPGIEKMAGEVIGFMLTVQETKQDLVYVTGDTVWYDRLEEVSSKYRPRVVVAFAGAAAPLPAPLRVTMDTNDAIELAHAFKDSLVVPLHYEGWAHFRQDANGMQKAFEMLGLGQRFLKLEPGVKTKVERSK